MPDIACGVPPNFIRTLSSGSGIPDVALGQQATRSRRSLREFFVQAAGFCVDELRLGNDRMFPAPAYQQGPSLLFPTNGYAEYAGLGTISQTLTTITGTGTNFLREVTVGSRLRGGVANAINGIVTVVTDDVTLTISTSVSVSDGPYSILR